jgi:hypothetical protein
MEKDTLKVGGGGLGTVFHEYGLPDEACAVKQLRMEGKRGGGLKRLFGDWCAWVQLDR